MNKSNRIIHQLNLESSNFTESSLLRFYRQILRKRAVLLINHIDSNLKESLDNLRILIRVKKTRLDNSFLSFKRLLIIHSHLLMILIYMNSSKINSRISSYNRTRKYRNKKIPMVLPQKNFLKKKIDLKILKIRQSHQTKILCRFKKKKV